MLSSPDMCLYHAKTACLPQYSYCDRGSIYTRNFSVKNWLVSDIQVPLLASYSVSYKVTNTWVPQVITTFSVLPWNTVKGSWEEKKKQHSISIAHFTTPLGERASKWATCQFFMEPRNFEPKVCRI